MESTAIPELVRLVTDAGLPVVLLLLLISGLWKLAKPFLQEIVSLHKDFLRALHLQIADLVDQVRTMVGLIGDLTNHVRNISEKQEEIIETQEEIGRGLDDLHRKMRPDP